MVENKVIEPIMGVVLAGGKSTRMRGISHMGEIDKPELIFQNKTFIRRAVDKLSPQVAEVCLSAPHSYGLDTIAIKDDVAALGPLGGVYSVLRYVVKDHSDIKAILTVPVDAPFFPDNLADELVPVALSGNCPALAETADGLQPAFACWPVTVLPTLEKHMAAGKAGSLKGFLKKMGAINVKFDDPHMFFNINSPEDLNKIL